jgi:hypothetical protein
MNEHSFDLFSFSLNTFDLSVNQFPRQYYSITQNKRGALAPHELEYPVQFPTVSLS